MRGAPVRRGTDRGIAIDRLIGSEVRAARTAAGHSMKDVSAAAGISVAELSRIERGLAPWLTISRASILCALVGLDLWARCYPGGDPLRDAAQLAIEARIRAIAHRRLPVRAEVPLPSARDPRAWDLVIGTTRM